ncbi:LAME_0F09494g1_1 [Lachancea meyersii CBS 8951]|uniref:Conserved oligomeric Golgi complex subunit 2 n=1 Tax=Lachancea meyersii CBS 8951 TaxID=1266667 RepID=A0A1G4JV66_9SACH|nr:LAME_0F09494g1_1 [Lachancea meyersii CBS 8951]
MDLLDDTWDLPVSKNINRELFTDYEKDEAFDIDSFLLDNNFHYVPLDTLSKDLTSLTQEMDHALLDASSKSYKDFVTLCDRFSSTTETRPEMQNVKLDLTEFLHQLRELTKTDIANTREIVADTVDYLQTLDKLSVILANSTFLKSSLHLARKLCNVLESLCADDKKNHLDIILCGDLLTQLHQLTAKSHSALLKLQQIDSPLMVQLRSEYHSVISQFRACLHVLCDKCVESPSDTKELAAQLATLIPTDN